MFTKCRLPPNEDVGKVGVGLPVSKCGEIEFRICPDRRSQADNDFEYSENRSCSGPPNLFYILSAQVRLQANQIKVAGFDRANP